MKCIKVSEPTYTIELTKTELNSIVFGFGDSAYAEVVSFATRDSEVKIVSHEQYNQLYSDLKEIAGI